MAGGLLGLTARILGWRLMVLLTASMVLYSAASGYVGGTLMELTGFVRDEPPAPDGLNVISVYSGVASTPVTGVISSRVLDRLGNVSGVEYYWGEITAPALVNGSLVIVRGVPRDAWNLAGLSIVEGVEPELNDYTVVLVGQGLARKLGIEPGDVLVVDSMFSRSQAVYRVSGVVEGPSPYRWEVIASPEVAAGLRGTDKPSVVRIVYDPGSLDLRALSEALGVPPGAERILLHQLVVLVGGGAVELGDPEKLQEYYMEHLGVPAEYVFATGVASDILLSSLTILLGQLVITLRRDPLRVLVEEGLTTLRAKMLVAALTLPLVVAGALAGLYVATLLPGSSILGYPVEFQATGCFVLAHTLALAGLYSAGLASARLEG